MKSTNTVTYEVRGATSGLVTMETPSGTAQRDVTFTGDGIVPDPVTFEYEFDSGDFLYVSIQNGSDSGVVTCAIFVNDTVVASNMADAAYGIASCER